MKQPSSFLVSVSVSVSLLDAVLECSMIIIIIIGEMLSTVGHTGFRPLIPFFSLAHRSNRWKWDSEVYLLGTKTQKP